MLSISTNKNGSLQFKNASVREVQLEEDKENDPKQRENPSKARNIPSTSIPGRRRHLSLVDYNRDPGRTVSVTELGGWTEVEEVLANKSRLCSVVDSLQKHRRNSSCVYVEKIYEDEVSDVSDDDWIVGEISLQGNDWNDLDDDQIEESVFPARTRFLTAANSLKKHSRSVSLSRKDDSSNTDEVSVNSSEKEELYQTEEVFLEFDVSDTSTCSILPDDVLDIDIQGEISDYSSEIVIYLRRLEKSFTIPDDFLDDSSVTHTMRSTLVDWLIQVQHHLKLCQETLYLAVSMLDLVLNRRDVDPDKLQLVGITTLLMATKLEEYYPVDLKKLLHLTEDSYSSREVLEMELVLIEVLDFQLYIPSPQVFLLRYTTASLHPADPTFLATCQYLLDSHLPARSHSCLPPSLVAAAAVLTTGLLFFTTTSSSSPVPSTIWTPTLIYYASYQLNDLLVTSIDMLDMILSSVYTGSNTKYKSMSQHSRLVLKDHLQKEVVVKARGVLDEWSSGLRQHT